MNSHEDDKLDPQDPARRQMQPPIPARPPDPAAAGETGKIVADYKPVHDPNDPPQVSTAISSGPSIDQAGGAGLGKAPGESDESGERPATARDRDTRAIDQQDRREQS